MSSDIILSFEEFDICMDILNLSIIKLYTLPDIIKESSHMNILINIINEVLSNDVIIDNNINVYLENILVNYNQDIKSKYFNASEVNLDNLIFDINDKIIDKLISN